MTADGFHHDDDDDRRSYTEALILCFNGGAYSAVLDMYVLGLGRLECDQAGTGLIQ